MEPNERQYWLWVTRPDYYLDEDGNDREDLDPTCGADSDGWWTCNKRTKEGDLVLLWRTSPRKDIGYLIQAESDAYSIADANDEGWDYGCDYEVLYKFEHPLHVKDLRGNPYFDEWGPLRCSFQRSNFNISFEYWNKLNQLLASNNPGYQGFIENTQRQPLAESIGLEKELEDALAANLKILNDFGYDLELYADPVSNQSGRQFICKGNGGRIDLLCYDKTEDRYVVIELKNVRASQNTFGQISNYMGWVQDKIAKSTPVKGLVISRGYDTRFESALKITDRIGHLNVEDLGFSIAPSKKAQGVVDSKEKGYSKGKNNNELRTRSAKSREAGTWQKKGNTFFDQEKYEEAINCYDQAIEMDPKNKWGLINKGSALLELLRFEEALSCFDKAVELYPKSVDAWCNKGFAFNGLDKFDDAVTAFDKAIEIKPKSADAWNGKGIVLANMEKYDGAIQAYDRATKIRPKFAWAWSNKGYALIEQGKSEEAIRCFSMALELDPKFSQAMHGKGDALYNLGNYDEAIRSYDRAIELDPDGSAMVWNNKGASFHKLDKYNEALNAYNQAIELDPGFAWFWNKKGIALCDLGKHDEAIQAYDKAIELDSQLADAWNNKGITLKRLGKTIDAEAAFAKAKELGYTG